MRDAPRRSRGYKRSSDEDRAQSQRFLDLARELQEKGELDPDDDGQALERLVHKVAPPKAPKGG
jgi:hypothetical protein